LKKRWLLLGTAKRVTCLLAAFSIKRPSLAISFNRQYKTEVSCWINGLKTQSDKAWGHQQCHGHDDISTMTTRFKFCMQEQVSWSIQHRIRDWKMREKFRKKRQ
jgi:hypothetical protein